jgi:hypothetical protein
MVVSEIISSNTVYYPSNFPSIETIVEATECPFRVVRELISLREVAPLALKSSAERLEEFKHYMDFVVQSTKEFTKSTVTIIKKNRPNYCRANSPRWTHSGSTESNRALTFLILQHANLEREILDGPATSRTAPAINRPRRRGDRRIGKSHSLAEVGTIGHFPSGACGVRFSGQ